MTDDRIALATEAFIYGFPLVFNLEQVERFTEHGMGSLAPAPFNVFAHAQQLAGPKDTFVSINNDTVYSMAQVDLGAGPLRLDVPDTAGRYYVLQFVDAWTNNFAYVGDRATGTAAQSYLLVPPGWDGDAPGDTDVIRAPTRLFSIVGRWAVAGEADLPAVRELQAQLTLTPQGDAAAPGLPALADGVRDDLLFFEKLRAWSQALPPAARDVAVQERFAPLGLLDPTSPFTAPDDELVAGLAAGQTMMEEGIKHGSSPVQNGWQLIYHVFDYNSDFFEIGTLDEDQWKIADPKLRYATRALAARAGLWGNHGYEAAYAMVWVDADGAPLSGSGRYRLRFTEDPPCGAFWSITMYDTPEFFLVENPIDRYSIGDRTPGLVRGADGSLTIWMQRDEPSDPEARANWLPTPEGTFRPVLRIYEPADAVFDGRFVLPPVERVR
ncbi:MAG: DUF1254 domain-containing protein [Solirubrobacteraceae bacterium]|nr:DUF1254 domain-containing protein [Solirubrobacteraceae bacterium]